MLILPSTRHDPSANSSTLKEKVAPPLSLPSQTQLGALLIQPFSRFLRLLRLSASSIAENVINLEENLKQLLLEKKGNLFYPLFLQ
jgi:hypothetical protein